MLGGVEAAAAISRAKRRSPQAALLKQLIVRQPRQIGRRKTGLHSQSLKLRTLRRRQSELKTRGVDHDAHRTQYVLRGNALPRCACTTDFCIFTRAR